VVGDDFSTVAAGTISGREEDADAVDDPTERWWSDELDVPWWRWKEENEPSRGWW